MQKAANTNRFIDLCGCILNKINVYLKSPTNFKYFIFLMVSN